jgi:hypothetical protein
MFPAMAAAGFPRLLSAGRPIGTVDGHGWTTMAGPGSVKTPGAGRPTTTGAGSAMPVMVGAGTPAPTTPVTIGDRPWWPFSAMAGVAGYGSAWARGSDITAGFRWRRASPTIPGMAVVLTAAADWAGAAPPSWSTTGSISTTTIAMPAIATAPPWSPPGNSPEDEF